MMAPTEDCRIREGLIHRSAWKGNSAKFVTSAHRTILVTVAVALRRR
jgi:hypothetical protein